MKNVYVYDLEQFRNFHSGIFYNISTGEYKEFVIHKSRDDRIEYIEFLQSVDGLIGFNNINYDYPMLHHLLQNPLSTPEELYEVSQTIIKTEYPAIKHKLVKIPQLDLFRMWHFNNKARMTSLKKIQVAMNWPLVQDLPLPFDSYIEEHQINDILKYNKNDVDSTFEFYKHSKSKIDFRKRMSKQYGIPATNYPDVKIGEEILIHENAKALGMDIWDFKQLRTNRDVIKLSDVILPYVAFKTEPFKSVLKVFQDFIYINDGSKQTLDKSIIVDGMQYDYGLGGIHGTSGKGEYISDEEGDLILLDVSSYYPNLAIRNRFHPKHLGKTFCEVGENLYNQRMEGAKIGDFEIVAGIKLALNGALFGKSNEKFSPMYDTQFFNQIVVNGQLLLSMLAEEIHLIDIPIIQINTDGILVKCPKDKRDQLDKVSEEWMKLTNLKLDYDHFEKVIQVNVNNYSGLYTDGKIKRKGSFEINKDWHKDHSMKAVRIAVDNYFYKNIPIEETFKQCSIWDFCKSFSTTKGWQAKLHTVNGVLKLQKTNRYFISKVGGGFYKHHEDGRVNSIEAGFAVTIINDFNPDINYLDNIDYQYYKNEVNKIINSVKFKQLSLF